MNDLSHVDGEGRAAMVDVSSKEPVRRTARARGFIRLAESTVKLIAENQMKKGDVLGVAEIAGVQAAKRTSELIPLCHPLQIGNIHVRTALEKDGVSVEGEVTCVDRTGVEMEALTAVAVSLLTVYDMCKAVEPHAKLGEITLLQKVKEDVP